MTLNVFCDIVLCKRQLLLFAVWLLSIGNTMVPLVQLVNQRFPHFLPYILTIRGCVRLLIGNHMLISQANCAV